MADSVTPVAVHLARRREQDRDPSLPARPCNQPRHDRVLGDRVLNVGFAEQTADLGGEMDDPVGLVLMQCAGEHAKLREVALLAVMADNLMVGPLEFGGQMLADEPAVAGDEDSHVVFSRVA